MKKAITEIIHRSGESDIFDTLYDKFIIENYNCTVDYHQIEPKKISEFIKNLQENNFKFKIYKFFQYNTLSLYIQSDDFLIIIVKESKKTPIYIYANNLEILEKLYNIFKPFEYKNTPELKIKWTDIIMTARGPSATTKVLEYDDFKNINELYYPFLDINLFMREFIYGDENILILCGEPGTGKSKFASLIIKKLLQNEKYFEYFSNLSKKNHSKNNNELDLIDLEDFIDDMYISNFEIKNHNNYYHVLSTKNIDIVSSDEFWDKAKNNDLVILDDLDFLLSSRNENREDVQKNQFLSNLLSFTDGIQKNKTKIIITTNQPFDTIDNALLRKGRLFAILEFRPLSKKEALKIWESENLDKKDFNKIFKDKDKIKHDELGHEIQKFKRNKKLLRKKDFILDESIDALRKAQPRKAGLI